MYLDPPPVPETLRAPPTAGPVLVVSPHADDEWIGPGGCLLHHHARGEAIHVVILTHGASADPSRTIAQEQYVLVREQESMRAAARVGATLEFWRLPDGARARNEDLGAVVPRLVETIDRHRPAVIYCPHDREAHGDHYVAAIAVRRAIAMAGCRPRCLGFEVWSPCDATLVVDVTPWMEEKQRQIRTFASQLSHTDILHFVTGLNAYRAVYLWKDCKYAEAFREMPADVNAL